MLQGFPITNFEIRKYFIYIQNIAFFWYRWSKSKSPFKNLQIKGCSPIDNTFSSNTMDERADLAMFIAL